MIGYKKEMSIMQTPNTKPNKRRFKMPSAFTILFLIIGLVAILTWIDQTNAIHHTSGLTVIDKGVFSYE